MFCFRINWCLKGNQWCRAEHLHNSATHNLCYLSLGGHRPCGHSHCVDSTVGIFMDLNVRFLLHVSSWVKEVQNFLVVKLQEDARKFFKLAGTKDYSVIAVSFLSTTLYYYQCLLFSDLLKRFWDQASHYVKIRTEKLNNLQIAKMPVGVMSFILCTGQTISYSSPYSKQPWEVKAMSVRWKTHCSLRSLFLAHCDNWRWLK